MLDIISSAKIPQLHTKLILCSLELSSPCQLGKCLILSFSNLKLTLIFCETKCSETKTKFSEIKTFSETKFFETETETFFRYQNRNPPKFGKSLESLDRNRYFVSETKFSKTKTKTFNSRPNSPKLKPSKIWQKCQESRPKPRLCIRNQIFRS